jgi:hypothetical protein
MKIEESRLAEAIGLLQKQSAHKVWGDGRRARRMDLRMPVAIQLYSDQKPGKEIQAQLRNISARGLGLFVPEAIEKGTTFIVRLPTEKNQPVSAYICQVVHCKDNRDETFTVGAEIIGHLDSKSDPNASQVNAERIRNSILS